MYTVVYLVSDIEANYWHKNKLSISILGALSKISDTNPY